METIIKLEKVTKEYKRYKSSKERFLDLLLSKSYGKKFHALKGIDFEAKKGESIGIIGTNGSGKSTLLNVIAGIVPETTGNIQVEGKISLLDVSAGLKDSLTGRENIKMKCLMLKFTPKEISEMEQDIIDFSELDELIEQPVKDYSKGEKARLGFAISVSINPDILIIDEALAVGDEIFAQKCRDKIMQFKNEGKTILFVSHNSKQVRNFCEKAMWLEYGQVKAYGEVKEVTKAYDEFNKWFNGLSPKEKKEYRKKHKFS